MLEALWWIYWIGFAIYGTIHLLGGSLFGWARVTFRGKVLFRVPSCLGALFMTILWPIIVPVQLAQNT
jgi:hypothetical protein